MEEDERSRLKMIELTERTGSRSDFSENVTIAALVNSVKMGRGAWKGV